MHHSNRFNINKIMLSCSSVIMLAIAGYGGYEWLVRKELNATTIFFLLLAVSLFFYILNLREMEDQRTNDMDNAHTDQYLSLISTKVSYYILLILLVILLFATEGVTPLDEINNKPLVAAIGLAFAINPMVDYFANMFRK